MSIERDSRVPQRPQLELRVVYGLGTRDAAYFSCHTGHFPSRQFKFLRRLPARDFRDRLCQVIAQQAACPENNVIPLPPPDVCQSLRAFLPAEETEVSCDTQSSLVVQIADMLEAIETLIAFSGIDRKAVLAAQQQRRRARGSFE